MTEYAVWVCEKCEHEEGITPTDVICHVSPTVSFRLTICQQPNFDGAYPPNVCGGQMILVDCGKKVNSK